MDGWVDGWMDGWVDGWVDGWPGDLAVLIKEEGRMRSDADLLDHLSPGDIVCVGG